jgi:hypothetical protein
MRLRRAALVVFAFEGGRDFAHKSVQQSSVNDTNAKCCNVRYAAAFGAWADVT